MKNKPLLSIAIPTYNRAVCLKNLLDCIAPQAIKLMGAVEICISNNGSDDNTREIVAGFQKKYPNLIAYNENNKNLGFDRNLIKIIEMSQGDFIWTFGDDDSIVENGLAQIVEFVKGIDKKNTGMIFVRMDLYFFNKATNQKIFCESLLIDKNKPETFEIDKKDIIGVPFSNPASMTPLIFNSEFLKNIIGADNEIIEKAVGTQFMHVVLRSLIFLKYSFLSAIALNKPFVFLELSSYKFFVEDKFVICYHSQKKLNNLLLSYKYMDNNCALLINKNDNMLKWGFVITIVVMRTFKNFNYFSYFGCLKLFFRQATFMDALLFSFVFSILFITPPTILVYLYKIMLMIRHGKKWKERWFLTSNINSILNEGTRRTTV